MFPNFLVDTKNSTYLSPYGMSILKEKPYSDLQISINENDIIEPKSDHSRKLFTASRDNDSDERENGNCKSFLIFHTMNFFLQCPF